MHNVFGEQNKKNNHNLIFKLSQLWVPSHKCQDIKSAGDSLKDSLQE